MAFRYLGGDVLLELFDLVVHDLELPFHLRDLVLRLYEVLAVQVAVAPHALVELLLLLELHLPVADLLAELVDTHLPELLWAINNDKVGVAGTKRSPVWYRISEIRERDINNGGPAWTIIMSRIAGVRYGS